jgi:hypothetical protein
VVAAMADVLAVVTVTVVAIVADSADSAVQWVLAEVPADQVDPVVDSAAKVGTDSVPQIAAGKHKYHCHVRR